MKTVLLLFAVLLSLGAFSQAFVAPRIPTPVNTNPCPDDDDSGDSGTE